MMPSGLNEIPDNIKKDLEIVPVQWIDQVLEYALASPTKPLTDDEFAVSSNKENDKSSKNNTLRPH